MVDESFDALFDTDFGNDDSQSMEELFSAALENVEDARKRLDRMHKAGVSTFTPAW